MAGVTRRRHWSWHGLGWLIRNTLTYVQAAIDSDNVHDIPGFRDVIIAPSHQTDSGNSNQSCADLHVPGEEAKKVRNKRKKKGHATAASDGRKMSIKKELKKKKKRKQVNNEEKSNERRTLNEQNRDLALLPSSELQHPCLRHHREICCPAGRPWELFSYSCHINTGKKRFRCIA